MSIPPYSRFSCQICYRNAIFYNSSMSTWVVTWASLRTAAPCRCMYLYPRGLFLSRKQQARLGVWHSRRTLVWILILCSIVDKSCEEPCSKYKKQCSLETKLFGHYSEQNRAGFKVLLTRNFSLFMRPNLQERGIGHKIHSVVNHKEVLRYISDKCMINRVTRNSSA